MRQSIKNIICICLIATLLPVALGGCKSSKPDRSEVRKKVGQLFLLAFSGNEASAVLPFIEDRGIGGLYLSNENLGDPVHAANLLNTLQEAAVNGISGLPLLTAADQEGAWGVMVPYSSTGPGNMALGASDVSNTKDMYAVFSRELAAVGVFCDLSPAADVNSNPLNPIIGTRSFGENAEEVAVRVQAAIAGLHQHGTIATAKHFPGHGNTATDSHSGIPHVSRSLTEIESVDLLPFKAAVEAGVDMVMTAHIIYDALDSENPATLSSKILKEYLREKIGFDGVIITDSFNMQAIQKNYEPSEAAIAALLAGADMIMLAEERYGEDVGDYIESQTKMLNAVEQAVLDGQLPMTIIDQAYNRIVRLKTKYKLAEKIKTDPDLAKQEVGSEKNRAAALACAEAALTVVYDNKSAIPLAMNSEVAVVKLAKEDVADIIKIAEGIGPNYANAYQDFLTEMQIRGFGLKEYSYDESDIDEDKIILAVSENYPFPGKSLDLGEQRRRLAILKKQNPQSTIINIALRDPYEAYLTPVDGYVCAMGSNIFNVQAVANLLAGQVEAKGKLPVTPISQ